MPEEPQENLAEESQPAAASSAKSKLSVKTLILIGLPLVMIQAGLAWFVVDKIVGPTLPENKIMPVAEEKKVKDQQSEAGDLSDTKTYAVNDVIVNPAETQGQRYLNVSVNLYIPQEIKDDQIAFLEPEIRQLIISLISQKRMDELLDYGDQVALLREIKNGINQIIDSEFKKKMGDNRVKKVVFSKYTLQ